MNRKTMNKRLKLPHANPCRWLATGALCLGLASNAWAQPESKTINDGWRFLKGECTAAADSAFDDARWEPVNLPHTWNTDSYTVKHYYQGPAWYRRTVSIPQEWSGKQILLHLEGVSKAATVYVNGHRAGEHAGGYTACTLDLTPYLHFGAANSLAIRADNGRKDIAPLSADFTFFGGIYRDVWLTALPRLHFNRLNMGSDGLFISTPQVSREEATVAIRGEVTNSSADKSTVEVTTTIYAPDGQPVQADRPQNTRRARPSGALHRLPLVPLRRQRRLLPQRTALQAARHLPAPGPETCRPRLERRDASPRHATGQGDGRQLHPHLALPAG